MNIQFDQDIKTAAPDFKMILIEADISNPPTSDELWGELERACAEIETRYSIDLVRHRPAIDATRRAYKACGKDPNRYRPSAEALTRRAVKGLDLYRTLTVIDLINYVSLVSGHSIGAFDSDKIAGTTLTLGVGVDGEPYSAIGRGELNIAGLPVYRDAVGGIGTPTSDNERTKLSENTTHLTVTINLYGEGEQSDTEVEGLTCRMLEKYAGATNIRTAHFAIADLD